MAMDKQKKKEIEETLTGMTVLELRKLARSNSIDISSIIRKREIIDEILNSGKAPELLGIAVSEAETKPLPAQEEMSVSDKSVGESEKPEKRTPGKNAGIAPKGKPDKREAETEQYIKLIIGNRTSFFEIDGMIETALTRYASGDYYGAVQAIQAVRIKASDIYSHFRIYTNALGIDASEKLLSEATKRETISKKDANQLIKTAKNGFVNGTPKRRDETLNKLERGALKAVDKIIGEVGRELEMNRTRANELRAIGADVIEPDHLLAEAEKLKVAMKPQEAKSLIAQANTMMTRAEKIRLEEIRYSIPRVRSAIEESKTLDIDVTESENELKKASYYLERGELKLCVDSLNKSESQVDQLLRVRISSDPSIRKTQLEKTQKNIQYNEPYLNDIASYGLDTSEAMHYLRNAQTALSRGDAINAPKFARRMESLAKEIAEEVEKLKKRSVHASDDRCARCNQEMLYDYDTGIRRCSNCGYWVRREKEEAQKKVRKKR